MADSTKINYQTTETRKTVRLPLYGLHLNRNDTTTKDQRYVNCFPETSKNSVTDLRKFFLVKRPGTSQYFDSTTTGNSRGVWYWNNHIYSVYDGAIYEDTTNIQTLNTTTGTCGGVVVSNPIEEFFICDGIDGYVIDKQGNISNVEKAYLKWVANTVLEYGDKYVPTTLNGYYYTATTVTGTKSTGAIEPIWPTVIGNTVTDGGITWTCTGTTNFTIRANSTAYTVNAIVVPASENGLWYKCIVAGTTGGSAPTYPIIIGDTVVDGSVTWECGGYYGGFPSPHIPTPVTLDGYLCLAEKDSVDMYNSWTTNVNSWNPLDFISAESFSDPIRGLARQNNYIVAFGDNNTEMFYDNANDTGSPFSRNESFLLQVGLLSYNSIMQTEKLVAWLGKSDAGRTAVWVLDGFSPKEVSTEYIEKILETETDLENIFAYGFRTIGHFFYLINLPTVNKTLVYDIEENLWHEWDYGGANVFPFNYLTVEGQKVLLQHNTNGKIYELDSSVYEDFDQPISVNIVTTKYDFDSNKRKFFYKIEIVGDLVSSNIDLSWSDDDYQTWCNTKTLSLSSRPYFMRGGHARRRAFKLLHDANTPLRLEFIELIYTIGEH